MINRRQMFGLFGGAAAVATVKSVEVLKANPKQLVVFTCDKRLSESEMAHIQNRWKEHYQKDFGRAMILCGGLEIKVLTGENDVKGNTSNS